MSYLERKCTATIFKADSRFSSFDEKSIIRSYVKGQSAFNRVKAVQVLGVSITNTALTLPENKNFIRYDHNPVSEHTGFTLAYGSYDSIKDLVDAYNKHVGSNEVVFHKRTGKVSITFGGTPVFIHGGVGADHLGAPITFDNNPIAYIFGFRKATHLAHTHTGDVVADLHRTKFYSIECPELAHGRAIDQVSRASTVIQSIPLTGDFGDVINYEAEPSFAGIIDFDSLRAVNSMTFKVVDSTGVAVDLLGTDWSIQIKIFHII